MMWRFVIKLVFILGCCSIAFSASGDSPLPVTKLTPQVRVEPIEKANPIFPKERIEPYLKMMTLLTGDTLKAAPTVRELEDGHVIADKTVKLFVTSPISSTTNFALGQNYQVVQIGEPILHPVTHECLGFTALVKGVAEYQSGNNPAVFTIKGLYSEIEVGDKLIIEAHEAKAEPISIHHPQQALDSVLLAVFGGVHHIATGHVVVVQGGSQTGLELGHLLNVYSDTVSQAPIGQLVVFKLFGQISLAIVTEARQNLSVGNKVA